MVGWITSNSKKGCFWVGFLWHYFLLCLALNRGDREPNVEVQGYSTFRLWRSCVSGESKFHQSFLSNNVNFYAPLLKFGRNNHLWSLHKRNKIQAICMNGSFGQKFRPKHRYFSGEATGGFWVPLRIQPLLLSLLLQLQIQKPYQSLYRFLPTSCEGNSTILSSW